MPRFNSKKEVVDNVGHVNDTILDDNQPIKRSSGGDLTTITKELEGKSEYFRKWKNEVAAYNPYLKHGFAVKANEYEVEDEILDSEEIDIDSEQGKLIINMMNQSLTDSYDPDREDSWQTKEEDLGDAPINDRCQIDNTIRRLGTNTPKEEIIEESLFKIQKYHNDPDYIPEFDINRAVDDGILLIESQAKKNTEIKFIRDNSK
jgi:hypothetical protein